MTDIVTRLQALSHPTAKAMPDGQRLACFVHQAEQAADEIERLGAALDRALGLCRGCDGTGLVVIADVETGEQIGAANCEKCWPLRINATRARGNIASPMPGQE